MGNRSRPGALFWARNPLMALSGFRISQPRFLRHRFLNISLAIALSAPLALRFLSFSPIATNSALLSRSLPEAQTPSQVRRRNKQSLSPGRLLLTRQTRLEYLAGMAESTSKKPIWSGEPRGA